MMVWDAVTATGASRNPARWHGPREPLETVLLVTDGLPEAPAIRQALQRSGYRVLDAADPEQAVATCVLHSGPIHLVVAAATLQTSTGWDLAARLRRFRPELKSLYLVGDPAADVRVLDTPSPLLLTPCTGPTLLWKVREVLDGVATTH